MLHTRRPQHPEDGEDEDELVYYDGGRCDSRLRVPCSSRRRSAQGQPVQQDSVSPAFIATSPGDIRWHLAPSLPANTPMRGPSSRV